MCMELLPSNLWHVESGVPNLTRKKHTKENAEKVS